MKDLPRRDFALSAAAAGVSALAACSGTSNVLAPQLPEIPEVTDAEINRLYDTIVVGAGAAGIAAARGVLSARRSVLVLEAQPYIGGRCRSNNSLTIPYDYGAQFMAQSASLNSVLYPLAEESGVQMFPAESVPPTIIDPITGDKAAPRDVTQFFKTYASVDLAIQAAGVAITGGASDASILNVMKTVGLAHKPYINLVYQFLMGVVDGGEARTQSALDL